MVMQSHRRVLTVEEAKALPPLTPQQLADRERALEGLARLRESLRDTIPPDLFPLDEWLALFDAGDEEARDVLVPASRAGR